MSRMGVGCGVGAPVWYEPPNLLIDGHMAAAGVTAWAKYPADAVITKETNALRIGSQCLRVKAGATADPEVYQLVAVVGHGHHLRGLARSDGFAIPRVYLGTILRWTGTNAHTDWQWFDFTNTSTTTAIEYAAHTAVPGQFCDFAWLDAILIN